MLKILKQELLFIPIMLMIMEVFRRLIANFYPETALFDRGSELESFMLSVWQIVWITSASWLLIRVVFPPAFRALKKFYDGYESFTDEYKQGFAVKLFACFFFGLVLLLSGKAQNTELHIRQKLSDTLHSQLHVRELTGHNDGVEVERYLAFVGFKKGAAWCAGFASYNLFAVGITHPPAPRTAWAPVFATKYVVWSQALRKAHKAQIPKPGDCFTLFYPSVNRVGHVGFIVGRTDNYFITIEGNTGLSGTREGSGVHKLKRSIDKVYTVSNYITPYITEHEKLIYNTGINAHGIMQPQDNKGNGENLRSKRAYIDRKGFNLVRGHYCENNSRQLVYRCASHNSYRKGKHAGNGDSYAIHEGFGIYKKWQVDCKMQLQRTGVKVTGTTSLDTEATEGTRNEATYRRRTRYKGSPLYPVLG